MDNALNDIVMVDNWADDVEDQEREDQAAAKASLDGRQEKLTAVPTKLDRTQNKSAAVAMKPKQEQPNGYSYELITESVENLSVNSPGPTNDQVQALTGDARAESQSLHDTESSKFVPGGMIRFLPKKLHIRLDPSQGCKLMASDSPPEPPFLAEPPFGKIKVGVSIDGFNPCPHEVDPRDVESKYSFNVPVFLTVQSRNPAYTDRHGRTIPAKYISFDQRFREVENRKTVFESLLHERDTKLKQAEEAYLVKLREWRIGRRLIEQDIVEAEWENQNFSIFDPETIEEDIKQSRRYVREQNQLDKDEKIHVWFNGNPGSLHYHRSEREHEHHDPRKTGDTKIKPKPTEKANFTYFQALIHGKPDPVKSEQDVEKERKIAEWKKAKRERRKENHPKFRSRKALREARKQAIIDRRDSGLVPNKPCPRCLQPGHWKVDCKGKAKVSKPNKPTTPKPTPNPATKPPPKPTPQQASKNSKVKKPRHQTKTPGPLDDIHTKMEVDEPKNGKYKLVLSGLGSSLPG